MERELKIVTTVNERITILADGANLEQALDAISLKKKDYESLFIRICEELGGELIAIHYFNGQAPEQNRYKSTKIKFFHALSRIPYLHMHLRKLIFDLSTNKYVEKGVDMELGVMMAELAILDKTDIFILISGDQDFLPAIELARRFGKRVFIVSIDKMACEEYRNDLCYIRLTDIIADVPDYDPFD